MARRGFFSRIGDALRNIVAPSPVRETREEEPREPPGRRDYKRIWDDTPHRRQASFRKNLELFHHSIDRLEPDPEQQLELWEVYVKNIVAPNADFKRASTFNDFWQDSGLSPSSFNWTWWREAMGYKRK